MNHKSSCKNCGVTWLSDTLPNYCPECGKQEITSFNYASESGAIVCYFASPLAIREQYKKISGVDISEALFGTKKNMTYWELKEYAKWLEQECVKLKGE